MIRIAKPTDPKKIEELRQKINKSSYLQTAVSGIAGILTTGLLQWNGTELIDHDTERS